MRVRVKCVRNPRPLEIGARRGRLYKSSAANIIDSPSGRFAAGLDRGRRSRRFTTVAMPASLLFAATKSLTQEELSALGSNGLLELCALDRRFHPCARHPAAPRFVRGLARHPLPMPRVQV